MKQYLPIWMPEWLGLAVPLLRITLVVLAAWLLRTLALRVVRRLGARYELPPEVLLGARKLVNFLVGSAALLAVLEALGVSGAVLWTAFTGFAAVAAVAAASIAPNSCSSPTGVATTACRRECGSI